MGLWIDGTVAALRGRLTMGLGSPWEVAQVFPQALCANDGSRNGTLKWALHRLYTEKYA